MYHPSATADAIKIALERLGPQAQGSRDVAVATRWLYRLEYAQQPPYYAPIQQAEDYYARTIGQSWAYAGGEKPGLSNGPYRADNSSTQYYHDVNPKPATGLTAQISWRPGTLKFRVKGKTTPRKRRESTRGKIRALTPKAKSRWLELIREKEALGYKPDHMISLTYPGDWKGSLSEGRAEFEVLRLELKKLNQMRQKVREAKANLKRGLGNRLAFSLLLEDYQEQRKICRALVNECRQFKPDGRKVKRHLSAFLKRFDRAHGITVEGRTHSYCAAQHLAQHLAPLFVQTKVRRAPEKILSQHEHYCEAAKAAKTATESAKHVSTHIRRTKTGWAVIVAEHWEVIAVRYRAIWWLEFQKRGAPHIHLFFYDTRGLDWAAIRRWAGPNWAATVAGLRSMRQYQHPELLAKYDEFRELWGAQAGRQLFDGWLLERGLNPEAWHHMRAGTRVERMEKQTWGYAAKEGHGGRSKAYQKAVPRDFQNVGRWWGHRKDCRAALQHIRLPAHTLEAAKFAIRKPLEAAINTLPNYYQAKNHQGQLERHYMKFKPKVLRFIEAVERGEAYGYISVHGQAAVLAGLKALGMQ